MKPNSWLAKTVFWPIRRWYEWRRHWVLNTKPNPDHHAIAKLIERLPQVTLITQNVDDLHGRADSHDVLQHGSLHHPRCLIRTAKPKGQLHVF